MSEEMYATDILQPVLIKDWPLLQNMLKINWPNYSYLYYWIENAISWKTMDPDMPIQMYSPNETNEFDTFIGISNIGGLRIVMYTQNLSRDILKKIILKTRRINWNKTVQFPAIHESFFTAIFPLIEHLKITKGLEVHLDHVNYMFKPMEECISIDVEVSKECYLGDINESHVPFIHSLWPHRNQQFPELSMKYLSTMVKMNNGMGLFLRKDNTLTSWVLHTDWNGLGMVQTAPEYMRKGYASTVINALAKRLAQKGMPSGLFVIEDNEPSNKMFSNLGWKQSAKATWMMLTSSVD